MGKEDATHRLRAAWVGGIGNRSLSCHFGLYFCFLGGYNLCLTSKGSFSVGASTAARAARRRPRTAVARRWRGEGMRGGRAWALY